MCTVSMIMDHGITLPRDYWQDEQRLQEFNKLMKKAKQYDIDNNEPDCELDDKQKALKKIADEMDIEIEFI